METNHFVNYGLFAKRLQKKRRGIGQEDISSKFYA